MHFNKQYDDRYDGSPGATFLGTELKNSTAKPVSTLTKMATRSTSMANVFNGSLVGASEKLRYRCGIIRPHDDSIFKPKEDRLFRLFTFSV
jgi:hypothetical protein